MKDFKLGERIVLEVTNESFNCEDCFFYDLPLQDTCHRLCGCGGIIFKEVRDESKRA